MSRVLPTPPKGPRRPGTAGSRQRRAELVALLRAPLPPSVPHGSHNLWGPCMAPWGPCTAPWGPYTSHVDLPQPCVDLAWPQGDFAQPHVYLAHPCVDFAPPYVDLAQPGWILHHPWGVCMAHGDLAQPIGTMHRSACDRTPAPLQPKHKVRGRFLQLLLQFHRAEPGSGLPWEAGKREMRAQSRGP